MSERHESCKWRRGYYVWPLISGVGNLEHQCSTKWVAFNHKFNFHVVPHLPGHFHEALTTVTGSKYEFKTGSMPSKQGQCTARDAFLSYMKFFFVFVFLFFFLNTSHHKLTLDRISDVQSFCNEAPDFHKIQMYIHIHTHAPDSVSSDLVRGGTPGRMSSGLSCRQRLISLGRINGPTVQL